MTSPPSTRFSDTDAYDCFMGRYSRVLAPEFARATGVEAGQRVLDVGCGPGALTVVLAGLVGADHVAAVDPSEPFVEQCRATVPGADIRLAPAEALPFEDESFDRTLAQLVFHFVSDPIASVGEMKRVTRPGGKVAACVWDFTGGMTMIRAYWDVARETDPDAPAEPERFGGKPAQIAELWRAAGLSDVEDTSLRVSMRYEDFDELWQSFRRGEGQVGAHAASLEGDLHDAVRAALHRRVGSPNGPFELTASAWCAIGTV
jgi:SAM-dependent methyltransferase